MLLVFHFTLEYLSFLLEFSTLPCLGKAALLLYFCFKNGFKCQHNTGKQTNKSWEEILKCINIGFFIYAFLYLHVYSFVYFFSSTFIYLYIFSSGMLMNNPNLKSNKVLVSPDGNADQSTAQHAN